MAAYACPKIVQVPVQAAMVDMPCAEMDKAKPVHCAEFQAGDELALEHLAAAPILTQLTISSVMPAIAPAVPSLHTSFWSAVPPDPGIDPPYLRTQRLRI